MAIDDITKVVGVIVLPTLALVGGWVINARRARKTERATAAGREMSEFDAIRSEWTNLRKAWADRIEDAEREKKECEERGEALKDRVGVLEVEIARAWAMIGRLKNGSNTK